MFFCATKVTFLFVACLILDKNYCSPLKKNNKCMIYSMIIFEKIFFSAIFPPFSAYFIRHTALNGV